jgi:hypothetical protein
VLRFLQEISPGYGFTEQWFRWKYIDNPMGPPYIYFAEDVDKELLAGIYCVISWSLRAGNLPVRAVQSVDTMINPAYRGQGIVKNLSELMFKDLREMHVDLIIGFPNEDFFPTTLKIGWKNPGFMKTYVKILSVEKILGKGANWLPGFFRAISDTVLNIPDLMRKVSCRGFTLEEVDGFTSYAGEDNPFVPEILTPRSPDYLKWRYENNPLRKYRIFTLMRDGNAVCRIVGKDTGREMVIIDIIAGAEEDIRPALVLLSGHVRKEGGIALRSSCYGRMEHCLRMAGFFFREDGLPIVTYLLSNDPAAPWNSDRNWYFMPGDIDVM